jgi:hypothetical protein
MALSQKQVRQTTVDDGVSTETTREVTDNAADRQHKSNVAERVVWFIAGIILTLLGLRFLFALLGANPDSGIASFIYGVTDPLVAPFFNLFSYDVVTAGASRVEGFTLVAMLIYALIAWGIAKALTLRRP